MESIGQILKAARERRQISIADVSAATKMTSTFVQAIEADNFAALVAPIYARGFIKLYAECVGVDPMPLLKQFGASGRAAPALAPPTPKAPPRRVSVAPVEETKPPRLQPSGPLPRHGATGKPEQEKSGYRTKAAGGAILAKAAPLQVLVHTPSPSLPAASGDATTSWLACLRAGSLSALNRMFSVRTQLPRVKLPDRMFQYFALPAIIWRRIFILAGVVLLIVAASLAWDWSHRGLPSTPDACRWLAEPPAPYLTMEVRAVSPK